MGFVEALHVYWFSFMCNSSAVSLNNSQENIVNEAISIIFCQDPKSIYIPLLGTVSAQL